MGKPDTFYRIEWRPKAHEDLSSIVRYINKESLASARAFGRELRDRTIPLAQHPELGRTGRPGLPEGVRELVLHPHYILFYRVIAEIRTVEILRVKHTAQRTP